MKHKASMKDKIAHASRELDRETQRIDKQDKSTWPSRTSSISPLTRPGLCIRSPYLNDVSNLQISSTWPRVSTVLDRKQQQQQPRNTNKQTTNNNIMSFDHAYFFPPEDNTTIPQAFHKFPSLPKSLRLYILSFIPERRDLILEVSKYQKRSTDHIDAYNFHCHHTPVPSILHAYQEARQELLEGERKCYERLWSGDVDENGRARYTLINPKRDAVRIVPVTYGVGRESPPTLIGRALDWMSIICPGIAVNLTRLAIPYTWELGHQDRFAGGLVRFSGLREVRLVTNHLPAAPNLSKTPGLRQLLDVKMVYIEGPRLMGENSWEKAVEELKIAMKMRIGSGRAEDGMNEGMVDGVKFVLYQLQPESKK